MMILVASCQYEIGELMAKLEVMLSYGKIEKLFLKEYGRNVHVGPSIMASVRTILTLLNDYIQLMALSGFRFGFFMSESSESSGKMEAFQNSRDLDKFERIEAYSLDTKDSH